MALVAKETEKKKIELMPEGVHIAICTRIIDVGSHKNPKFPDQPAKPKAVLFFDFPHVRYERDENGTKVSLPRSITKQYTNGLGGREKPTNLAKDLVSWRGRAFTDLERKGFSLVERLGKPCQIQIVHETEPGKEPRAVMKSIMALPAGFPIPTAENQPFAWSIEDSVNGIPETFPDWVIERIKESDEYKALSSSLAPASEPSAGNPY